VKEEKNCLRLDGKTAVITGASKGIGKAIAYAFGLAGARVVISSRKQERLDVVAAEFEKDGITALPFAAHVGDADQRRQLISRTVEAFGKIDILVNNAATNPVFGPLETISLEAADKTLQINLLAPFALSNAVLPHMPEGGSIIHISSVEGERPGKYMGMYSVSKAALSMLTRIQAGEWAERGIRVNGIAPGLIRTKFSQALWDNEKIYQYALRRIPLRRMGRPEEIAALALFLASDMASYVTGSIYTADGGYLAQ